MEAEAFVALPAFATFDDFLAWECDQQTRHEYVGGRAVPWGEAAFGFAGSRADHSTIAGNVFAALHAHLRGGPCRVHASDMLVKTFRQGRYPDVSVTCTPDDGIGKALFLEHPRLLVEVLSTTTQGLDLGDKFDEYTRLPSLEEYALVDSTRRWARLHRRVGALWTTVALPEASLPLESVGLTLDFGEMYERTTVP